MGLRLLPWILEQEAGAFQRLDRKWRPQNLLPEPYRRSLLKDIQGKYERIFSALDEFTTLDRGAIYVKLVHRMRLYVQKAKFAWRFDDLAYFQAVTGFYSDYGTLMRLLATDKARGRLDPSQVEKEG
jgi:hypothetical protein